jgi:Carboxypeptidase regulatory-like domain
MRSWGKISLFTAAVVLAASALFAATPMTTLKVVVKTQSGKPVDRAEVIIQWKADPKKPRTSFGRNVSTKFEMRSNQEGEVTMPPIPQGNIRVQINAKGYQTFGEVYLVESDEKTIEVKLNPPQQQYTSH